jgi:hypothetical protein
LPEAVVPSQSRPDRPRTDLGPKAPARNPEGGENVKKTSISKPVAYSCRIIGVNRPTA